MPSRKLLPRPLKKPWGRTRLWPGFEAFETGEPIGEIWFMDEHGSDPDLLVKYLFTSETSSVQVHPNDDAAQARGFPRGKDEAWLILQAEPDARIALGPVEPLTPAKLRNAAKDGSIVDLLCWRPVKAGDFIYSPAGTIHAIGAGLTLIEIQQNLDLTYRLYDHGRSRALQLDDAVAVANLQPFEFPAEPAPRPTLTHGLKFVVDRVGRGEQSFDLGDKIAWVVVAAGRGCIDGQPFNAGDCWSATGRVELSLDPDADVLLAY